MDYHSTFKFISVFPLLSVNTFTFHVCYGYYVFYPLDQMHVDGWKSREMASSDTIGHGTRSDQWLSDAKNLMSIKGQFTLNEIHYRGIRVRKIIIDICCSCLQHRLMLCSHLTSAFALPSKFNILSLAMQTLMQIMSSGPFSAFGFVSQLIQC